MAHYVNDNGEPVDGLGALVGGVGNLRRLAEVDALLAEAFARARGLSFSREVIRAQVAEARRLVAAASQQAQASAMISRSHRRGGSARRWRR